MKKKILRNLTGPIPMNIQMYAEGGTAEGGASGGQEGNPAGTGETSNSDVGDPAEPTREELIEKLAAAETRATQAEADAKKWKNTSDKTSSEVSNLKKQLTAKMTAEEQLDAAKKEAEEAKEKELNDIRTELSTIRATKRYMTLEMSEEKAEETAKAEISGDMEKVTANIAAHIKEIKKTAAEEAINKFLADRPDIKAGNGDAENVSLAEEKAKQFVPRKSHAVNADDLKRFM